MLPTELTRLAQMYMGVSIRELYINFAQARPNRQAGSRLMRQHWGLNTAALGLNIAIPEIESGSRG